MRPAERLPRDASLFQEKYMKKLLFALAAISVMGVAGTASAQSRIPLSFEVRGDAAIPTGDFKDGIENGLGFTASAALQLVPGFGVYGSYGRTEFSIDGADDSDVLDQGFGAGLTAALGGGLAGRATPYIGAGLLFHELEVNDQEVGDAQMGFEVGAGIAFPLGRSVRITPAVGYRQYKVENTTLGGVLDDDFNVSYLTAGVGLNIAF
jgi:opacity protein-like surface antigen